MTAKLFRAEPVGLWKGENNSWFASIDRKIGKENRRELLAGSDWRLSSMGLLRRKKSW